jgi:hypothetical protein
MAQDPGTPADLDLLAECDRLFFYQGAAVTGLYGNRADTRAGETAENVWKLLPFIKALVRVGQAHESELRAEWALALQEPMPNAPEEPTDA